jgi:hypothetical protein
LQNMIKEMILKVSLYNLFRRLAYIRWMESKNNKLCNRALKHKRIGLIFL